MIFHSPLHAKVVEAFGPQPSTSSSSSSISSFASSFKPAKSTSTNKPELKEDEVDIILAKTDGRLQRKRDPKLCRHNSNGCCVHCSPLEPWDEEYLKEHKIKHLSFHSYIRKLTSGVDRGKFVALEDLVGCQLLAITWSVRVCRLKLIFFLFYRFWI